VFYLLYLSGELQSNQRDMKHKQYRRLVMTFNHSAVSISTSTPFSFLLCYRQPVEVPGPVEEVEEFHALRITQDEFL